MSIDFWLSRRIRRPEYKPQSRPCAAQPSRPEQSDRVVPSAKNDAGIMVRKFPARLPSNSEPKDRRAVECLSWLQFCCWKAWLIGTVGEVLSFQRERISLAINTPIAGVDAFKEIRGVDLNSRLSRQAFEHAPTRRVVGASGELRCR